MNLDPKEYDRRFWKYQFMIMIEIAIGLTIAAQFFNAYYYNVVIIGAVCAVLSIVFTMLGYFAIQQIGIMQLHVRAEIYNHYGKDNILEMDAIDRARKQSETYSPHESIEGEEKDEEQEE